MAKAVLPLAVAAALMAASHALVSPVSVARRGPVGGRALASPSTSPHGRPHLRRRSLPALLATAEGDAEKPGPPLSSAKETYLLRATAVAAPVAILAYRAARAGMLSSPLISIAAGGALSGGLHAVSGPDHMAALLPRCVGRKWWKASRTGALWGAGHGLSVSVLGLAAYGLRSRLSAAGPPRLVARLAGCTEVLVGLSLVGIGVLGLLEAREIGGAEGGGGGGDAPAEAPAEGGKTAVLINGLLHGLSLDGAPSFAPALALGTWSSASFFLAAYVSGTVLAMAVATGAIGEATARAGAASKGDSLTRRLTTGASGLAIAVGVLWTGKAVL